MEIKKGERISDQLAEILRERTSKKDREKVAKKHGIHVNSINNRIFNKREPVSNDKVILDLCQIAFRNNDSIIEKSMWLDKFFKKLFD